MLACCFNLFFLFQFLYNTVSDVRSTSTPITFIRNFRLHLVTPLLRRFVCNVSCGRCQFLLLPTYRTAQPFVNINNNSGSLGRNYRSNISGYHQSFRKQISLTAVGAGRSARTRTCGWRCTKIATFWSIPGVLTCAHRRPAVPDHAAAIWFPLYRQHDSLRLGNRSLTTKYACCNIASAFVLYSKCVPMLYDPGSMRNPLRFRLKLVVVAPLTKQRRQYKVIITNTNEYKSIQISSQL